jgi:hypothetical protein
MAASILSPVKTQQTVNLEKSLIRKNIQDEKAQSLKSLFERNTDSSIDEGVDSYNTLRQPIVDKLKEKEKNLLNEIDRDFMRKKQSQLRLASILSRFSPMSCLAYALTELSNTGLKSMNRFFQTTDEFNNRVETEIYSRGFYDEIPGHGMKLSFGGWVTFDDIPKFQLKEISTGESLYAIGIDATLLIIFNLLFFSGAYLGFLKYDVR